jgi:hypothetical protein
MCRTHRNAGFVGLWHDAEGVYKCTRWHKRFRRTLFAGLPMVLVPQDQQLFKYSTFSSPLNLQGFGLITLE